MSCGKIIANLKYNVKNELWQNNSKLEIQCEKRVVAK